VGGGVVVGGGLEWVWVWGVRVVGGGGGGGGVGGGQTRSHVVCISCRIVTALVLKWFGEQWGAVEYIC